MNATPAASRISVRKARPEDLPRLLELMQQLAASGAHPAARMESVSAAHEAALRELLNDEHCHLLVLESSGLVEATCVLYLMPNISHGAARWAVVENVVVEQEHRGLGYGERLMTEAERLAREGGAYRLSLMSNNVRAEAHRFYRRIGYEPSHQGFTKYLNQS